MSMSVQTRCPGCQSQMPRAEHAHDHGYYNCSPECWGVYSDVLGFQFSNAVLFSQVHQLTVDTYAVQHAGAQHPDKSVAIHLAGLFAALELGIAQMRIPALLQPLAQRAQGTGRIFPGRWPMYR